LKKTLLVIAAASAASIAFAATPPAPAAMPPEVRLALNYLQEELEARFDKDQGAHLDQPSGALHTDAQTAAVRAVFGDRDALAVTRLPAKGGNAQYAVRVPGNTYKYLGVQSTWPEATLQLSVAPGGNKIDGGGVWPGIDIRGADYTTALHGVGIHFKQARKPAGTWLGKSSIDIDSITFTPDTATAALRAEKTTIQYSVSQQGKKLNHVFGFHTKRMTVGKAELNDINMSYSLRNLDSDVIAAFQKRMKLPKQQDQPEQQQEQQDQQPQPKEPAQLKAPGAMLIDELIKPLILRGASLDINDISVTFGGGKIQLKGVVGMPSASKEDFESEEAILNKLKAHLEIRLPTASLRSITHEFQKSVQANAVENVNTAEVAQNLYEFAIGKLLANGYARLEKDTLISVIDISDGQIRINDSLLTIPLKTVLKQLNQPDAPPPPPKDDTPPVAVAWEDRSLENLLLFAGNKHHAAINALCVHYSKDLAATGAEAYKWCSLGAKDGQPASQDKLADMYRDGIGVEKDAQLEKEWRQKARENMSDHDDVAPTADNPTQRTKVRAGFYDEAFFRFDDTKSRSLELLLEQPQQHEKWGAMLAVCLSANAPSDVACLSFSRNSMDGDQLIVRTRLISADHQEAKDGDIADATFTIGEKIGLQVFVQGQDAVFIINGKYRLTQRIVFQPQLIGLTCSTATCNMTFK
jgi:hypothetical protein